MPAEKAAALAEEEGTKGGRRPAQAAAATPTCPSDLSAEWLASCVVASRPPAKSRRAQLSTLKGDRACTYGHMASEFNLQDMKRPMQDIFC